MHDHVVAHLDPGHAFADLVDDSRCIRAADVEVFLAAGTLALSDHIDRLSTRRPDVVEVHARGHDRDQHLTWARTRRVDLLDLERFARVAEARLTNDLGQHARRHVAYRRHLADRNRFFDSQGANPP